MDGLADLLLRDLARWTFGATLAERASFHALPAEALSSEVRAYRYGILLAAVKHEPLRERAFAEAVVGAPWELLEEWAALASGMKWGPAAQETLALHFLARMQEAGQVTEALRRFAFGKAHKYGRRVLFLAKEGPA